MRLLSYNIRRGGSGREQQIAAVVKAADPDIVVLQEATDRSVVKRIAFYRLPYLPPLWIRPEAI